MPRPVTISPTLRTTLLAAWHGPLAVSEIALAHNIAARQIYPVWAKAKRDGLLPNRPRAEGNVYPKDRKDVWMDHDIVVPDNDPLLFRLRIHHRPGHGELNLRSLL